MLAVYVIAGLLMTIIQPHITIHIKCTVSVRVSTEIQLFEIEHRVKNLLFSLHVCSTYILTFYISITTFIKLIGIFAGMI